MESLKNKVFEKDRKQKKEVNSIGSDIFSLPSPKRAVRDFRSKSVMSQKYVPDEVIEEFSKRKSMSLEF